MDRRALGCLFTGVHFVLATAVIAVLITVLYAVVRFTLEASYPGLDSSLANALAFGVPFGLALLLLALWQLGVMMVAVTFSQRAVADVQEGRFLEASERVQRLRNREPWLRLAGMGNGAWARLRVAEAYAYALHGQSAEAARIALEEARFPLRLGLARAAAAVASIAAVDVGDPKAWDALAAHLAWAERDRVSPNAQTLLACRGQSRALALDFAGAERDVALLEGGLAGGRAAAGLRASIAFFRGNWDDADRELVAAKAALPAGFKKETAVPANVNHAIDALRVEAVRMSGNTALALSLAEALALERPTHRSARIVIAMVRGEKAGASGDAAGAAAALADLEAIAAQWPFSPATLASLAIARTRVERARGENARALAALAPALASRHPAVRQGALLDAGEISAALGDAEAARRRFSEAAALGTHSGAGARAAAAAAG